MGSCWAHCRGGSCNHDYWLGNRPLVFEVLSEADAASRRQSGPSWRRHGSVYSERFVHPRNESGRDFSRAEPVEQDNVLLLEEACLCPNRRPFWMTTTFGTSLGSCFCSSPIFRFVRPTSF